MSVFTVLRNLLIGPLELFFEIIYAFAYKCSNNPGLSIILLSIVMNFLVLPLYKKADAMQAEARDTDAKLNPWVTHIKKTFKGDERFMILQTYYRQNHYKPTDALRGSLSLLLEVPFFMAAYNFLSGLHLLQGVSFGPIRDLGAPDGLLVIAGYAINVLPILMTTINLIAGYIYMKGFPLKSKIQLYGMALIFLVLLYGSPAGLVFYWTLNNLFSLFKNIFYKLKNPKYVFSIASSVIGACLTVYVLFVHPMTSLRMQVFVIAILLMLQLPLILYFAKKRMPAKKIPEISKQDKMLFFGGCIFITLITGLLIPSTVIKASPQEFIDATTFTNPLVYILNSFSMAAGLFLVWFGIFYMLASASGKKIMSYAMWALSGIAVVNYMFFGTNYGLLSPKLQYEVIPSFPLRDQVFNLAAIVAVAAVLYLIWRYKSEIAKVVYLAAGISMIGMSVFNMIGIQKDVAPKIAQMEATENEGNNTFSIPLSKDGQNVVVLMLDRAFNAYVPYMFQEKPELIEKFDGFTYYPNTTSFGGSTLFGAPPLYGGYEYTPEEMNKRSDELLETKHNEALKVLPVLFHNESYEVTVSDPPYAGYDWIPDLSIFDDYPDIHAYNSIGQFDLHPDSEKVTKGEILNRNLFCFGLFKIAPVALQPDLYNNGMYNNLNAMSDTDLVSYAGQVRDGLSKAQGYNELFINSYAVLKNLPSITNIKTDSKNTFLFMCNDTTHEPMLLQAPQYEPSPIVDNTEYDAAHTERFVFNGKQIKMDTDSQIIHYHANMASMIQLGEWFDYLRENDVYDNTRIIIASDHAASFHHMEDREWEGFDLIAYNPLLMVKDFNATGFTTDDSFMTNADVPTIATKDIIANPTNPFTGNPINNDRKFSGDQNVIITSHWEPTYYTDSYTFSPATWIAIRDNIFDTNNWKAADIG